MARRSSHSSSSSENQEEIPGVTCDYCHNDNPESLVYCRVCKRWFCNSTSLREGSHAFLHMSYARHYFITSHPASVLKGQKYYCSCGNNNIFDLHYRVISGNVTMRCLSKCLSKESLSDKSFDIDSWKPIIDDRRITTEFCFIPRETPQCANLSAALIRQYEHQRVSNKLLRIENVRLVDNRGIRHVQEEYANTLEFYNVFEPLLRIEEYDQQQGSKVDGDKHQYVQFYREHHDKGFRVVAVFKIHQSEYSRPIRQYDELTLTWCSFQDEMDEDIDDAYFKNKLKNGNRGKSSRADNREQLIEMVENQNQIDDEDADTADYTNILANERIEYVGDVKSINAVQEEIGLYEIKISVTRKQVPERLRSFQSGYYDIRLKDSTSMLNRRLEAIKRLDDDSSVNKEIFEVIMGNKRVMNKHSFYISHRDRKMSVDAPKLYPLNQSQHDAVVNAMRSRFTLIQGPPGTGKTSTAATLVYNLVQRNLKNIPDIPKKDKDHAKDSTSYWKFKNPGPILVCAPSNVAADEICARIHITGVHVVRLMAISKENLPSPVEDLCVHVQARRKMDEESGHYKEIRNSHDNGDDLNEKEWRNYLRDYDKFKQNIIKGAQVVVSTCDSSGSPLLREMRFNTVLVDEASQATECETLIPIVHGAERVVLVGDQKQLQPVVISPACRRAGMGTSMFERLINTGMEVQLLRVQYRMHPELAVFPNREFYGDQLQDGIGADKRKMIKFCYPNKEKPIIFWNLKGRESIGSTGSSFLNTREAVGVVDVVKELMNCGVKMKKIGVITSYTGQKLLLKNLLIQSKLKDVECASVNTFQGRELDYIVLSCVRSNPQHIIGFLKDPKRLNVALTRARYGLIIVGDVSVLKFDDLWKKYLTYHFSQSTLVEGTVGSWRNVNMM